MVKEEGLSQVWQRHQEMHQQLADALAALEIEFLVDASCRLPQLNAVKIPSGVDDLKARQYLLNEFNLEIRRRTWTVCWKSLADWFDGLRSSKRKCRLVCPSTHAITPIMTAPILELQIHRFPLFADCLPASSVC